MVQSRRRLLVTSVTGVAAFFLRFRASAAQEVAPVPSPSGRSNSRRDGPEDPENGPMSPAAMKKATLEQHQKDIKSEIEKLYDLATQLKTEIEKTDATSVLSMGMVKKAEEIEKLARQIKDHAKGS